MRDREIVGLWEAYLQVHQPKEEVEQLDEDVQGAVKGALEKGANFMKTNPVGKAVGSIIAPVGPGRKTPTPTSGGYRKEEVEELDEISKELAGKVVNARIARTGRAFDKEMKDRTPENMRASMDAADKEGRAKRLAAGVRKRRNATNEEVENWVNSLIDEGYDLSEYTWDDMYEIYINENRAAARDPEGYEENERRGQSSRQRRMNDPHMGINSPAFQEFMNRQMGRPKPKKKKIEEETDLFDAILEHLVAEGYADTNESALVIMANMSEEWRESIIEAEEKEDKDKNQSKTGLRGDETKKKPKGWRPTGPKLRYGERPGYMR